MSEHFLPLFLLFVEQILFSLPATDQTFKAFRLSSLQTSIHLGVTLRWITFHQLQHSGMFGIHSAVVEV